MNPLKKMITTQNFGNDIINWKPYYSRLFGMKWHDGWDGRSRIPEPIYAVCDGVVTCHSVSEWRPYGNFIDLVWQGYLFRYAHLTTITVKNGQSVKEGDILGTTGNTWKSGWPHLHFGCYKVDASWNIHEKWNGYYGAIDPIPVLDLLSKKPITMAQFKDILATEFPDAVNLVSDYSDETPLTTGNAKALIVLLTMRVLKARWLLSANKK